MAMRPGKNIAIKVPSYRYDETVAFYRDALGLEVAKTTDASTAFIFGAMTLWIDRVPRQSQVDVWLEMFADDGEAEVSRLVAAGVPKRDELEPLDGVTGHWISDPAGTVVLVREAKAGE
ncbi:MAG TPA: VOC family protein [Sphingomonadaceae bacterium]|nr:VOC family protein [Sphingomonadaceae bacterium]